MKFLKNYSTRRTLD